MIIAVASGKGGTGKTTVATALSLVWKGPVRLLDTDVEEPNCRFFLDNSNEQRQPFNVPVPQIDTERCTGCGACSSFCAFGALVTIGSRVMVFPNLCHSCGGCEAVCPEQAITEIPRQIGTVGESSSHRYGLLDLGVATAPPLIREVKKPHRGASDGRDWIIDSPPGASCPMTAAVKGADLVLMVCENTPFGAHDLEKALAALEEMDIPAVAVINRSDLGGGKAEQLCQKRGIPVLARIPFDRKVAEAYARGRHPVHECTSFRKMMEDLVDQLKERERTHG